MAGPGRTIDGRRQGSRAVHSDLNGIQTQSAQTYNLLPELAELRALGVDVLRISPRAEGAAAVVEAFADCLRGQRDPVAAAAALDATRPYDACDGY